MSNALTTMASVAPMFHRAIDLRQLAPSTKHQYKREIDKALAAGVDPRDPDQLAEYAATLPKSSRAFLRSAVRAWAKRAALQVKGQATPENVAQAQAAVMRLDALQEAIKVKHTPGVRSHVWLTPRQVVRLKAAVDTSAVRGRRDRVLLALLVGAGLRRAEAVALRWSDVKAVHIATENGDRRRVELQIRGKGAKDRVVPLNDHIAADLEAWRKETGAADDDRILQGVGRLNSFTDDLTAAQVYNVVRKYGAVIGVPELAPHDLRRTYARIAYDNGISIAQISILLGHSSIETTRRYLGLQLDRVTTASDFIPW